MTTALNYDDITEMFGITNKLWIDKLIQETLEKLNIKHLQNDDAILNVIQQVFSRIMGVNAGTPIGSLIAFQLSEKLSQDALDSTHNIIVNPSKETTEKDDVILQEFSKSITFPGLLSNRKSKLYNFINMVPKDRTMLASYTEIQPDIYAIPLKDIHTIVSYAKQIKFITQPYTFTNQLCTFISCKNLYDYFAKLNSVEHLTPLFHVIALLSSKSCTPIPISRHGLKRIGIDFFSSSSFENILENLQTGALDQKCVNSNKRSTAIFLSQKLATGTNYFDLISQYK